MKTNQQFVITISREIGSGGRTIGRKLAERLGVRYCDKTLLQGLMQKFDLSANRIEQLKGEKKSWLSEFAYLMSPVPRASLIMGMDARYLRELRPEITTDDIYRAESDILRALAAESSCVIAGRSAFFVLRDHPNKFDVFITASRENRLQRVMAKQGIERKEAEELIDGLDRMRENYIQRFSGRSRYDLRNYHLSLNVDELDEDQAADLILDIISRGGK